jgi:hypothetical protein
MKREWWADGPEDDRDEAAYDRALEQVEHDGDVYQAVYDEITERFGENLAIVLTAPVHGYTDAEILDTVKDAAAKVAEEIARKESAAAQSLIESWREGAALSRLED